MMTELQVIAKKMSTAIAISYRAEGLEHSLNEVTANDEHIVRKYWHVDKDGNYLSPTPYTNNIIKMCEEARDKASKTYDIFENELITVLKKYNTDIIENATGKRLKANDVDKRDLRTLTNKHSKTKYRAADKNLYTFLTSIDDADPFDNENNISEIDNYDGYVKQETMRIKTFLSTIKNISESVLYESLTTKKEDLPDVKTGEAFKVTFYDNGEYVGEASVSDDYDGDKLCFCYNIEVKKDLRGQGYGTKIMQHMIDKYHIKSLQVAPDNDVAIHLYKKLGFKKTGEVRMSKTRVDDRMELPSKKRLEPYLDEEADPFYMTTDYMKYHILTNYFDIDGKDFDEIDMNVLKNIKVSDIKRDRYYMNADNDKLERLLNRTINNMISDLTKKINNAKTLLQSIKRDPNNNVIRTEIKPLVYRNNSSDPDIEVSCGCIIGTEALGGYFTQRFSYKKILCVLGVTKSSVKVLVYGDEGVEVKYIAGTISDLLKNINIAYRNK